MSENPVQALFHNFEQVANFVQHHISNFIGNLQSSGPSGRGSVNASIEVPFAKTTSSVQPIDPVLKVSIINGLQT
jgi:FAD-linked sulfhydryl oxidase